MKAIWICLVLLVLAGCGLETHTLPQFYEGNLSKVTKITIVDGNTGNTKTATDRLVIKEFMGDIKDIKFIPEENQESRDGFNYSINLYQDNEKTFSFSLGQVEDDYYYTEPDIYPIVDEFYKEVSVKLTTGII